MLIVDSGGRVQRVKGEAKGTESMTERGGQSSELGGQGLECRGQGVECRRQTKKLQIVQGKVQT